MPHTSTNEAEAVNEKTDPAHTLDGGPLLPNIETNDPRHHARIPLPSSDVWQLRWKRATGTINIPSIRFSAEDKEKMLKHSVSKENHFLNIKMSGLPEVDKWKKKLFLSERP